MKIGQLLHMVTHKIPMQANSCQYKVVYKVMDKSTGIDYSSLNILSSVNSFPTFLLNFYRKILQKKKITDVALTPENIKAFVDAHRKFVDIYTTNIVNGKSSQRKIMRAAREAGIIKMLKGWGNSTNQHIVL